MLRQESLGSDHPAKFMRLVHALSVEEGFLGSLLANGRGELGDSCLPSSKLV